MGLLADELIARLDAATTWPLEEEKPIIAEIARWIAFRENDRDFLRKEAGWTNATERYMIDPLPERLSGAFASLLFGRQPKVKTAEETDQERMDELLRLNRWGSRLRSAEESCSSEGEVFWRWVSDPARFTAPVLTWHSRLDLIPHYVSQNLGALGFTDVLPKRANSDVVFRHFEVHDNVGVYNVLFAGTDNTLGDQVSLDDHPATTILTEAWEHDLGMLAGRIINIEGADPELGKSDYDGIEDWFLELNECLSTGKKNRGLTALKRAYGPREATDETGSLPEGQNFMAVDSADQTWGQGQATPFGVIDFAFDAQALITWSEHVATTALARRGITPQFVGQSTDAEGFAQSGTALRMRLIPSTNEGDRRAGPWSDQVDSILLLGQQLDARSVNDRGFGQRWAKPDVPPAVTLGDPLPVDRVEDSIRLSTLRTADLISIETGVREQHPDWDDDQIDEEVQRIKDDAPAPPGANLLAGGGPAPESGGADQAAEDASIASADEAVAA